MIDTSSHTRSLLIVDDSAMNRALLTDILSDDYSIIEAEDGVQAVSILQEHAADIMLVVLDIVMPNMDGFEVLTIMNERGWIKDIPVITISAEYSPAFIERAYNLGVTDFITRPFDALVVRRRISNTVRLYSKQRRLVDMVSNQIYEKERNNSLMVTILSHIVEFRNGESGLHVLHIGVITEIILRYLSRRTDAYNLDFQTRELITTASALHDIGKISIDESILNKPGRLTDEEFEIMKQHTLIGYNMLLNLPVESDNRLVEIAREICRWHHERYDGGGYPDALVGDAIPISAQVVSLADVYDALTSKRVYKSAYSHEEAIQMILNGECGAFNPLLLDCLFAASEEIKDELKQTTMISYEDSRHEIDRMFAEIQDNDDLSMLNNTLELLDLERQKYEFAVTASNELLFEYNYSLDVVTFSPYTAQVLGVSETVSNPKKNTDVSSLLREEDLNKFIELIRLSSARDPFVKLECNVHYHGAWHPAALLGCTLWSSSDNSVKHMTGVIGKLIDVENEAHWFEALTSENRNALS